MRRAEGEDGERDAIKRTAARTAHNAHFTHIRTSTMTVCKAHVCAPRGLITSSNSG
jgi:hypothetical protein